MAKVDDVAAAVVEHTGPIDTWKLQKLVYYCQAWHLVWEDRPLFTDRIEAWANGPVIPKLYQAHRLQYRVASWKGDPSRLAPREKSTIESVLDFYSGMSGLELSALTHRELPWGEARKGLAEGERGNREITKQALLEFYGGLVK